MAEGGNCPGVLSICAAITGFNAGLLVGFSADGLAALTVVTGLNAAAFEAKGRMR